MLLKSHEIIRSYQISIFLGRVNVSIVGFWIAEAPPLAAVEETVIVEGRAMGQVIINISILWPSEEESPAN